MAGLRQGLVQSGDQVRLLTSSVGTAGDGHADYIAYGTERFAAQAFLQVANPFAIATVRRAVREFRPDVAVVNMFAHHLSPAALLPLSGTPSILLVSDYKCICPLGFKLLPDGNRCNDRPGLVCLRQGCVSFPHWLRDVPRYALLKRNLGVFSRIVACSNWTRDALLGHGIEAEALHYPAPLPPAGFQRTPSPSPRIFFAGRLDREKGADLLLRAFAHWQDRPASAHLRIAGLGPLRASLEDLAVRLGIADRVAFAGWLDQSELEEEYRHASALVVPSLWAETLGLVAVMAVLRGVPVIASEHGGLAEIVEPGVTGLLFPNGDEAALADRLQQLASGTAFPGFRLPEDAVERATGRFNQATHIKALRRIMEEVAESKIHTQSRA
ncbi:MAG: glycosyltransferase family 4 protein [Verrucomicrobia bacterium]|nr:glycosyltransferase family 4 protein [Verrucomicrobiota bacterium]